MTTIPTSICKQHPNSRSRTFIALATLVCYDYRTSQLLLLSLSRIEAMRIAFWSAESEALHSAVHYGQLKTRLYHKGKRCGPLKARLKTTSKSQSFVSFFYI